MTNVVNKIGIYLTEKTHCCQTPADSKVKFIAKEGTLCIRTKLARLSNYQYPMTLCWAPKAGSQRVCMNRRGRHIQKIITEMQFRQLYSF